MLKQIAALTVFFVTLGSCAYAAPEQWIEVKSDHFTVVTDSNEKQARQVVDQFERMRWMFQTLFPKVNVDPPDPIVILAAKNYKAFQALEPAEYLAKGQLHLEGLFLKTEEKNYVLLALGGSEEHPYATVYHEYTHLQFASTNEWMPLWLGEGMAEFIQNTDIHEKDVRLGRPSADDILYLRQTQLLPLETLLRVDHNSPYYHDEQKGSVFYAESWALTHYLEVNDNLNHTHQVSDYMNRMSRHEDSVEAAKAVFGDLKRLQSSLSGYIQNGNYREFVLNSAAAPLHEETYKVRPLTQAAADAVRADFLACVGRKAEALTLLDSVLAAEPNNARAFETKGYLAFRDGDRESARKWYSEAVKADSQSYLANYYYAVMSRDRSDSAEDAQIEQSLRAAIRLKPTFAPAYDELAIFFAKGHRNLDEAYSLSLHAIELNRSSLPYRLNASNILMEMGKYTDAVAALTLAAKLAKDPGQQSMVKDYLSNAQRMQDAKARADREATVSNAAVTVGSAETIDPADEQPKHPTMPVGGPTHQVLGVVRDVKCSGASVIEMQVVSPKKTVTLYNNNYYKLDLSVLGFDLNGEMNPCKNLEGFKARVQYQETTDKSVDGQVMAIELRK